MHKPSVWSAGYYEFGRCWCLSDVNDTCQANLYFDALVYPVSNSKHFSGIILSRFFPHRKDYIIEHQHKIMNIH